MALWAFWPFLSKLSSWLLQDQPSVSYIFTLSEPSPLIFCLVTTIRLSVLLCNQVNLIQCWTKLHWNYPLSIWDQYQKPLTSKETVLSIKVGLILHSINCLVCFAFGPWLLLFLAFLIALPSPYVVYSSLNLFYTPNHTCIESGSLLCPGFLLWGFGPSATIAWLLL